MPSAHPVIAVRSCTQNTIKGLNPFWLKVPFPKSGNWVPRIAEKLKPLCSIYVVSCSLLVCCIAAWQFAVNSELFLSTSVEVFHRSNWAYLLLTWVVLKLVHELAHAVVCAQTGSEVSEAGLVFVLFAPLAYVNVTSCWRLSDRWETNCCGFGRHVCRIVDCSCCVSVLAERVRYPHQVSIGQYCLDGRSFYPVVQP